MVQGQPVRQIYTTAHFNYVSSSHWYGELSQVGLRLGVVNRTGAPDMGETFTLDSSETPDLSVETGSYTAATSGIGTIDYACNWRAGWGVGGLEFVLDLAAQKAVCENWFAWWEAMRTYLHSQLRLASVKIAGIQADGKYTRGASEFRLRTPRAASSASTPIPPETSAAISIGADILGRTGRGRMFLPGLVTSSIASDGTISSSLASPANTATKNLIDGLQGIQSPSPKMPLVAVTSAPKATAVRPQYVRVGCHADVQRRRQHQILETYTTLAL